MTVLRHATSHILDRYKPTERKKNSHSEIALKKQIIFLDFPPSNAIFSPWIRPYFNQSVIAARRQEVAPHGIPRYGIHVLRVGSLLRRGALKFRLPHGIRDAEILLEYPYAIVRARWNNGPMHGAPIDVENRPLVVSAQGAHALPAGLLTTRNIYKNGPDDNNITEQTEELSYSNQLALHKMNKSIQCVPKTLNFCQILRVLSSLQDTRRFPVFSKAADQTYS